MSEQIIEQLAAEVMEQLFAGFPPESHLDAILRECAPERCDGALSEVVRVLWADVGGRAAEGSISELLAKPAGDETLMIKLEIDSARLRVLFRTADAAKATWQADCTYDGGLEPLREEEEAAVQARVRKWLRIVGLAAATLGAMEARIEAGAGPEGWPCVWRRSGG